MKLFIPLLVSLTLAPAAWANECPAIERDLKNIERHLSQTRLANCQSLTPEGLGLTGATMAQQQLLTEIRCGKLSEIDDRLAQAESYLLVEDGLRELTTQVVAQQQALAGIAQWRPQQHQLANRFLQDVALAALVENLHDSELSVALKGASGEGGWIARSQRLCAIEANRTTSFCVYLGQLERHGTLSSLETEFGALMSALPATGLSDAMAAQLAISGTVGGSSVTSFDLLKEALDGGGLEGFLQGGRATPAQVALIRGLDLRAGPTEGPLRSLLGRLQTTRSQMLLGGAIAHFESTASDAAARHHARARGRWASLWQESGSGSPPCIEDEGEAFTACVETNYARLRGPQEASNVRMKETILSGSRLAQGLGRMVESCISNSALPTLATGQRPVGCEGLDVSGAEAGTRELLTAMREKFREQEATWLRFRARALSDARECATSVASAAGAQGCLGQAAVSIGEVLTLSFDTFSIVDEGLRARDTSEFNVNECAQASSLPSALSEMCVRLHRTPRERPARDDQDFGPDRRDDIRPSDIDRRPEFYEAVGSAFNEVFSAWNQRNAPAPSVPWWNQGAPQRAAYSSPYSNSCWSYSACALSAGYANGLAAQFPVNPQQHTGPGLYGSWGLSRPGNLSSQFFPSASVGF